MRSEEPGAIERARVRTILVPLDGSAFGEQALPVALSIARRAAATVCLAQVHDPALAPLDKVLEEIAASESLRSCMDDHAYLDRLARRAATPQLRVERIVLDGPIADTLARHARATDVDMIVMSTHGHGALRRIWLGSVAAALVRQSPAPVLLVRPSKVPASPAAEPIFRHILIALDESPLAEQAIAPAVSVGSLMNARYTLLEALDPLVAMHTHPPYAVGLSLRELMDVKASAATYLARTAARLRARSLQAQTALVVGPPPYAICDYARAHHVDLIALATHGRGLLSHILLGNVADTLTHMAETPVLLVRPQTKGSLG